MPDEDKQYQTAVDWLLNKQYPDEQDRFWALAEGAVTEDEVDRLSNDEIQDRRAATR